MKYIKWRKLTKKQRKTASRLHLPLLRDDAGELVVAFPDDDQPIGTVESVRTDPETGEQVVNFSGLKPRSL